MISDMERGKRKPGHYRPWLCDLYGKTAAELGIEDPAPTTSAEPLPELDTLIGRATSVDLTSVAAFQQQVDAFRLLDRQLGSPTVVDPTSQLVTTINDLMVHVIDGRTRSALAAVLSDAAALNAWQLLNGGEPQKAWRLHALARTAGMESGEINLLTHAIGEQVYDLIDIDRTADALTLAQAARAEGGTKVSPVLRAWLHAVEAEAYANVGDDHACRKQLELAESVLPDDPDVEETPYISLNRWHLDRWRGNVLSKLGDSAALESLLTAVESTPAAFVRAASSLHCDIAQSYAARGENVLSMRHVTKARTLARQTGSIRQLRRIETVSRRLA
ncbi:hypothetical protein ACQEVB_32730 [Pseudonocardia sp. CA-107938]|uniref:hypothetical protein n=1 Tax=Pseudonocardia sp. CA-107938 TaxID=3240021 RepID=UPI003D924F9E